MDSSTYGRHPKQLYLLFFTEMWERFSFYGMKALLLAYMVTDLNFSEDKGYSILGAYVAMVYTMPVFGGLLADRFIGYQRAVLFGGILMTIGHVVLALPEEWSFFAGMAFIICGNGFFKPTISSMVGKIYEENDPRRDSGFSIFYMGINLGAALGGALCGWMAHEYGWHYGFGLAGIFMALGTIVFYYGRPMLGEVGKVPNLERLKEKLFGILPTDWAIYLGTFALVPLIVFLFGSYEIMDGLMLFLAVASLLYLIYEAFRLEGLARTQLLAATWLIAFSALFWAFYEQNSGSLNLFAMRNVDMHVAGIELPALSVNNFLPPAWVIALSPVFAWLWVWLGKRNLEPSTSLKFALSFLLVGVGFLVFFAGTQMAVEGKISLLVLALGYFFLISGELCISPIGLSMITKLSPTRMVGMIMGIWFLASALGDFMASKIGKMMIVPQEYVNDPVQSLPYYSDMLQKIGFLSLGVGVLGVIAVPLLKKWMGNVR